MPRKRKPLVVKGDLKVPTDVQPWERELLLPLVIEAIEGSAPTVPAKELHPRVQQTEDEVREQCHRLGVTIDGRQVTGDGSVLLACRMPMK